MRRTRDAMRSAALSLLGPVAGRDSGEFLRCVYCHFVFDDQVARFAAILRVLLAHGSFVDTAHCVDIVTGRRPLDGRYFHLSFDDGFRNVLTNAAPVLLQHGVPATVFVPTGLVGGDARVSRAAFPKYADPVDLLTWRDVRELHAMGFEIGSHTRGHVNLAELATDRLEHEITGSKQDIEDRLGAACTTFSWPFGRKEHVSPAALEAVRAAGYESCFGAFRGGVEAGTTDPFGIPRNHFEPHWRLSHVKLFSLAPMFA